MVVTLVDDSMIMDCYRLAHYYHLDPRLFLEMPISEVQLHLARTAELERSRRAESSD